MLNYQNITIFINCREISEQPTFGADWEPQKRASGVVLLALAGLLRRGPGLLAGEVYPRCLAAHLTEEGCNTKHLLWIPKEKAFLRETEKMRKHNGP